MSLIVKDLVKGAQKPTFETRRNATRRAVTLPCQAVRERDFILAADRTLDISTEGMLVPMHRRVAMGDQLIVSFQIPGMWIDAEAIVARIVHNRRPGDDGVAAGLVFDRISSSARAALAGYLHGRREPAPRRPFPVLADLADITCAEEVDAIGILRAVVCAWQGLGLNLDA